MGAVGSASIVSGEGAALDCVTEDEAMRREGLRVFRSENL